MFEMLQTRAERSAEVVAERVAARIETDAFAIPGVKAERAGGRVTLAGPRLRLRYLTDGDLRRLGR
jgi:hypothetical protein